MNYLARRDYSEYELTQKLTTKGYRLDDIKPIIANLSQRGLLSNQRFAENYLHWQRNKGYGPLRIATALNARGIHAEMIAEVVQIADNAWFNQALKVWQKHFKRRMPTDYAQRAKHMRFLQYRGFTREQIEFVLKSASD